LGTWRFAGSDYDSRWFSGGRPRLSPPAAEVKKATQTGHRCKPCSRLLQREEVLTLAAGGVTLAKDWAAFKGWALPGPVEAADAQAGEETRHEQGIFPAWRPVLSPYGATARQVHRLCSSVLRCRRWTRTMLLVWILSAETRRRLTSADSGGPAGLCTSGRPRRAEQARWPHAG
jgi:hypothetical protein